ncbi:ABHD17B [Symbiodinium necroappetens]|uniref:ABHD17B protein n=1 Tax=Symbiodinium necroappetens TaxID=1628268 RepID=A0A812NB93_9DINO|nr:ABHD17B [Symbiodinium necroappetens]
MSRGFNLVNTLLFPAPEASYDLHTFPEEELIWLPRSLDPEDPNVEANVPCLFLTSNSARFVMLYMHSNAEDLGRCYNFCNMLRMQFQVNVLAVEYPGYGICPGGQADEVSVIENAKLAFRFVTEVLRYPSEDIIVLGRSVGSGPALHVAAMAKTYGVILICPFLSVKEVVRCHLGRVADLIEERFPNKEKIRDISGFLLIVHGKKDTVVPWTHGQELFETCTRRKRLVTPEDMTHNASLLTDPGVFIMPVLQFFGLPDYSFEPLRIPSWVFDATLTPTALRTDRKAVAPKRQGAACNGHRPAPKTQSRLIAGSPLKQLLGTSVESDSANTTADAAVQMFLDWQDSRSRPLQSGGTYSKVADDLPKPPDDDGFFKVPKSHNAGPTLTAPVAQLSGSVKTADLTEDVEGWARQEAMLT